ncbi:hypothetical protein ANO11243_086350 [Dothideomycetidae sp. 11243]|nr:hypothetical protein ANO11243_086350 [fungal sp. No.11243]
MSSSGSDPTAAPPSPPPPDSYPRALHNLSLACLVLCPALIALPPRRFDLFTASLGAATVLSANHLHRERYQMGFLGRLAGQHRTAESSSSSSSLPTERAREFQAAFRARNPIVPEEKKGLGEKLWYGGADKRDWKEKRDREVMEKFEQGKGIGDVIMDQIWEVWNWGRGESSEEEIIRLRTASTRVRWCSPRGLRLRS